MCVYPFRFLLATIFTLPILLTACNQAGTDDGSATVADQFMRAYYIADDMAAAVQFTSGSAQEKLGPEAQQIESEGITEPVQDKPIVQITHPETKKISPTETHYVYQVTSEGAQIAPITAKLSLTKDGNNWTVSKFVEAQK